MRARSIHLLAPVGCLAVTALLALPDPAPAIPSLAAGALAQEAGMASNSAGALTDVVGLLVGHHTLAERPTGCTVVIARQGVIAGVDVRGGAPGTRETDLLDPVNTVQKIHAVVLSGGSAFGLDAASGTVRWLDEQGIGYDVGAIRVPIVTAAILFDLGVGGDPAIRPGADCGYRAAAAAGPGEVAEGTVGAGAGATVGKLAGSERAVKGGIGTASITLPDGLIVAALVAVNAVGDVVDPATGAVLAGARDDRGGFLDARKLLRSGDLAEVLSGRNTTIGVVATNAVLTQAQATKVAQMAQDGLARTIVPAHTPADGDTIFALATGAHDGPDNLLVVGGLAAEVTATAILRAVRAATGVAGVPSVSELRDDPERESPRR